MRRTLAIAAAAACLAAAARGAPGEGDAGKPLPFDKTTILPSGGTYYVEGRVRIPKGVEITVQKESKIVAHGKGAVIELAGELVIRGVKGGSVPVEGVTIELQKQFEGLRTELAEFRGESAGVVTPKDTAVDGRLFLFNTKFEGKSTVDVAFESNDVDLQRIRASSLVRVKGVVPAGATGNKTRLMIMNCCNGPNVPVMGALTAGLVVEGVGDVTVRCNELGGEKAAFTDCASLTFDTNWVRCRTLEMKQSAAGRFGRTLISKCDFQCEKVVLSAPAAPGKSETIPCDKCWFGGEVKEKAIRDKFFLDRDDAPGCNVTVDLQKIMEKPLNLAGTVK